MYKFAKLLFLDNNIIKKSFNKKYIYFKFLIITEMQNKYPIPKDILSYFIKQIFDNGFWYVKCLSMSFLIDLATNSSNIKNVKFDLNKFFSTEKKEFLLICLPYKLNIWKSELKTIFSEEYIINLFNEFQNARGTFGLTNNGFTILLNTNYMLELKDIEELLEHEFVHMFKYINNETAEKLSFSLSKILYAENELDTFTINLMNRLDKIYNNYCINKHLKDTIENRKIFLSYIFNAAKTAKSEDKLIDEIQQYDSSKQLEINMIFLWQMVQYQPPEFTKFKLEIEGNFLNE